MGGKKFYLLLYVLVTTDIPQKFQICPESRKFLSDFIQSVKTLQ